MNTFIAPRRRLSLKLGRNYKFSPLFKLHHPSLMTLNIFLSWELRKPLGLWLQKGTHWPLSYSLRFLSSPWRTGRAPGTACTEPALCTGIGPHNALPGTERDFFQILLEKQKLLYQIQTNKSPNSCPSVHKHQNHICQQSYNPEVTAVFHRSDFQLTQHQQRVTLESVHWEVWVCRCFCSKHSKEWLNSSSWTSLPTHQPGAASWAFQILFLQEDTDSISQE